MRINKEESLFSLKLQRSSKLDDPVIIYVWPPVQEAEHKWVCHHRIGGIEGVKHERCVGFDPFQSLMLVMQNIRRVLDGQTDVFSIKEVPHTTIFPKFAPIGYGEEFQERLEAMIDNEIKKEEERLTKKYQNRK